MNSEKSHLPVVAVIMLFFISGCVAEMRPTQSQETEERIAVETAISSETPPSLPGLTPSSTVPSASIPTSAASLTPSPVPTQAVVSGIVSRLCPDLRPPLGLFFDPEPIYDHLADPATLYVRYSVLELDRETSGESCSFYLSPPPLGAPQFAGDTLFWMSFDDEAEWVMVWKYDPEAGLSEDGYPQHLFLRQTRTDTSFGKAGLFDFVVDQTGQTLVWSYTDPQPYDDNQLGFVQSMFGAATSGPIDQRPPADIWFDFVPEGDTGARIIRPLRISPDGERVYYSQEPVGLGRQWPEPRGRYTSLFSISTWGDAYPEILFDCGPEFWCISDFSEELGILVSVQSNVIQIIELSSGDLIQKVFAPADYPLIRQALIREDGTIAFLGAAISESENGDPPEDAAIFLIPPPYSENPIQLVADAGLLNLIGWASPSVLLANGNNLAENAAWRSTPAHLMLVNAETGSGTWLSYAANLFVSLIY